MPVKVVKRKNKFRVVEVSNNKLVRARGNGKPVDSGGHKSKAKALRQAGYINSKK